MESQNNQKINDVVSCYSTSLNITNHMKQEAVLQRSSAPLPSNMTNISTTTSTSASNHFSNTATATTTNTQNSWKNELLSIPSPSPTDFRYSAFDSLRQQSEGDKVNMGWSMDMVKASKYQG